jgi:extracellular factor (EF) 3-hydroxypalmitic acid methyl ester biosynthesis protein
MRGPSGAVRGLLNRPRMEETAGRAERGQGILPVTEVDRRLDDHFALPAAWAKCGGPAAHEHRAFTAWLAQTARLVAANRLSLGAVHAFWRSLGPAYLAETLQGHALAKPLGYPGDFSLLDRIHAGHVSEHPAWRGWDGFFQEQAAPRAVRNRIPHFRQLVADLSRGGGRPLRVLDLGSGPARVVAEGLRALPRAFASVTCVDLDQRALDYGARLCRDFAERVTFQRANVLRYQPEGCYDLVWAAGLFDYFSQPRFVSTLSRLAACLGPGGALVVGNFSPDNPTRDYMELVGDWRLRHRSAAELRALAAEAGFRPAGITVDAEPEGVNLFLRAQRLGASPA